MIDDVAESGVPPQLAAYPDYEVVKQLGRGGMGVVYLAKNKLLDRLEVLKVLNERLLNHSGAKERFLRETRAVSKLNHPNIITSYSILPINNLLVFAMEYVQGMDLLRYIQKHRALSIPLACSIARQVAIGLQHAYEQGLVHRDIKPSNVMVYNSSGAVKIKILDFGLAKASSEKTSAGLTQDGTMLGTPEYMSPEQTLNAASADIRADIYSLGCTIHHMLCGRPPFSGTHGAVLLAHAQQEPASVNLVRPEVPAELAAVVRKMLAKQADRRYQTPAEVAAALTPFLNSKRSVSSESIDKSQTEEDSARQAQVATSVQNSAAAVSLDAASNVRAIGAAQPVAHVPSHAHEDVRASDDRTEHSSALARLKHPVTIAGTIVAGIASLVVPLAVSGFFSGDSFMSGFFSGAPNGRAVAESPSTAEKNATKSDTDQAKKLDSTTPNGRDSDADAKQPWKSYFVDEFFSDAGTHMKDEPAAAWFRDKGCITTSGSMRDRLLLSSDTVTDGVIRLTYRLAPATEAFLVFRSPNERGRPHGYAVAFGNARRNEMGRRFIYEWWYKSGETHPISDKVEYEADDDQWHTLLVAFRGSAIVALFDDGTKLKANNARFTSGRIGLAARNGALQVRSLEYLQHEHPLGFIAGASRRMEAGNSDGSDSR